MTDTSITPVNRIETRNLWDIYRKSVEQFQQNPTYENKQKAIFAHECWADAFLSEE